MAEIKKILVANRGEIALRIMRSAREMGIETVAVFSEADRNALHVRFADEAYFIGPSPSSESYLVMDKIIETARLSGADAIHPGYGFLSENASFAEKVGQAGLIFIGPSSESIRIMGSKLAAKEAASKFNVPLVPGTDKPIERAEEAKAIAAKVGYPIIIKASAGGGGKGMRVVEAEEEIEEQMTRAISEAKSSFGDGAIFIEKFITKPRHIEIQIFGDQHGNVIHFFERDCSIQRRHQKVIEEAPSGILSQEKREAMGKAAIEVAKSCNYYGAGTVEFIVDDKLDFYFLEMNTRLQVEHPVTEEITGIDLVKLQIKIAQGEKIPFKQEDLRINGHAIEVRVYAEDPTNNFLPDTGTLKTYIRPQGHGIRVDDGFEQGMEVPFYYDPMIAKLVVHAETREQAIEKMIRAIDEYQITGIETTLSFCSFVMKHKAFRSADFNTKFVEQYYKPQLLKASLSDDELQLAAILASNEFQSNTKNNSQVSSKMPQNLSSWKKNRLD